MTALAYPEQRPKERAADALEMLLAPCSPAEFMQRYFEREPLHVHRSNHGYFDGVYDVDEVESSIVAGALEHDKFCVIKSGEPQVAAEQITIERHYPRARHTGRKPQLVLDPRAILAHFDKGYTLVIKDASLYSARLQKFLNRIQQRLGFYVQANVYFTPPKAQGFDVHHDTHDTLVMQIEGKKTWRVYEPVVELPIETQPFSKEDAKRLKLVREISVEAGDTLYVPRGFPHEAMTAGDRSLHVTLALCPMRVIDLLEAMMDLAAVTDVELRRSLPFGWHESKEFPAQFAALLRERLPQALPAAHVPLAAYMVLRDLFATTRAGAVGNFEELERSLAMAPSSVVALRDDTPFMLRRTPTTLELLVAGKTLSFPASYAPLFDRLQDGPLTIPQIDNALPGNVGRQLVKMLLLEGLVSVN